MSPATIAGLESHSILRTRHEIASESKWASVAKGIPKVAPSLKNRYLAPIEGDCSIGLHTRCPNGPCQSLAGRCHRHRWSCAAESSSGSTQDGRLGARMERSSAVRTRNRSRLYSVQRCAGIRRRHRPTARSSWLGGTFCSALAPNNRDRGKNPDLQMKT